MISTSISVLPKIDLFSSRLRLENIIKTKRLPHHQAPKNYIKSPVTSQDLLSADNFSLDMTEGREGRHCNGSFMPPRIKGFEGPLNYNQLKSVMSGNDFLLPETPFEPKLNSPANTTEFVYYLCDNSKVLSTFTNQRFFRLDCKSPLLEPEISITEWPKCHRPTHCIGRPAFRYSYKVQLSKSIHTTSFFI